MAKINYGQVKDGIYQKYIDFNKAVLWKTRQLSVHKKVKDWFDAGKFKEMKFIDSRHNKKYTVEAKKAFNYSELKKVGQEEQYYFTISILKTI